MVVDCPSRRRLFIMIWLRSLLSYLASAGPCGSQAAECLQRRGSENERIAPMWCYSTVVVRSLVAKRSGVVSHQGRRHADAALPKPPWE
eukprot:5332669-Amphidinium_carterae.1